MSLSAIAHLINPPTKSLGDFDVRRALPYKEVRSVGPFVFWDEMGPADMAPGTGLGVRPHPHIGLSTVTYLFEGGAMHRDTLGTVARIIPGDVNLMTAGRGIAHSERQDPEVAHRPYHMWGIQSWIALPVAEEECEPSFQHVDANDLPKLVRDGVKLTIILGTAYGATSPAKLPSPTLYVDAVMPASCSLPVCDTHEERAVYVAEGEVTLNGETVSAHTLAVLHTGAEATLKSHTDSRLLIFGGAPLDGPRHMFWNFVSHDKDRLEKAKQDWRDSIAADFQGSWFCMPPDEDEYIPLPGEE